MIYPVMLTICLLLSKLTNVSFDRRLYLTVMFFSLPLSFILDQLGAHPTLVLLPVSFASALPGIVVPISAIRQRWKTSSSILKGFIIVVIITALHGFDYAFCYPFFNTHKVVLEIGFSFIMVLLSAMSLFCPAAILEMIGREKAQLEFTLMSNANLTHAAKLSALGEMAGGVAHEINNPLQIISGYSGMIKRAAAKEVIDQKYILEKAERIAHSSEKISKIVSALISFSQVQTPEIMAEENLHEILEETLVLCRKSLELEGIRLEIDPAISNKKLYCRKGEIKQVILNLISNAKDALREVSHKWIRITAEEKYQHLEISIWDSGDGVPEELANKIFDPFYSTKEIGKYVGLGLSVSRGIIDAHEGQLWHDHDQGYTRFAFTVPLPIPISSTREEVC